MAESNSKCKEAKSRDRHHSQEHKRTRDNGNDDGKFTLLVEKTEDSSEFGVTVKDTDTDYPMIVNVKQGSYAAKSGLLRGDYVITVNGMNTAKMSLDMINDRIRSVFTEGHVYLGICRLPPGERSKTPFLQQLSTPSSVASAATATSPDIPAIAKNNANEPIITAHMTDKDEETLSEWRETLERHKRENYKSNLDHEMIRDMWNKYIKTSEIDDVLTEVNNFNIDRANYARRDGLKRTKSVPEKNDHTVALRHRMRSATVGRQFLTERAPKNTPRQHSENRNIWSKPGLTTLMVDVYTPSQNGVGGDYQRHYNAADEEDISPTMLRLRQNTGSVSSLRARYENVQTEPALSLESTTESISSDTELVSMPRRLPSFSSSKDVELRNAARYVQLAKSRYRTLSSTSGDERRDVVTVASGSRNNSVEEPIKTIKIPVPEEKDEEPARQTSREKWRKSREKVTEKPRRKDDDIELTDTIEELDKLSRRDSWIRNKLRRLKNRPEERGEKKKPRSPRKSDRDRKFGKQSRSEPSLSPEKTASQKKIIDIVISPTAIYTNNNKEIISIQSLGKIKFKESVAQTDGNDTLNKNLTLVGHKLRRSADTYNNHVKCGVCLAPIGTQSSIHLDNTNFTYHQECFMCKHCGTDLLEGTKLLHNVFVVDGLPYCDTCIKKMGMIKLGKVKKAQKTSV